MILMSRVGYKNYSDKQKSDSRWSGCNTELFAELSFSVLSFLYISCIREAMRTLALHTNAQAYEPLALLSLVCIL